MKLEDLASKVFVDVNDAGLVPWVFAIGGVQPDRTLVFEITNHRWVLVDSLQKVRELSQHTRTDYRPLEMTNNGPDHDSLAAMD